MLEQEQITTLRTTIDTNGWNNNVEALVQGMIDAFETTELLEDLIPVLTMIRDKQVEESGYRDQEVLLKEMIVAEKEVVDLKKGFSGSSPIEAQTLRARAVNLKRLHNNILKINSFLAKIWDKKDEIKTRDKFRVAAPTPVYSPPPERNQPVPPQPARVVKPSVAPNISAAEVYKTSKTMEELTKIPEEGEFLNFDDKDVTGRLKDIREKLKFWKAGEIRHTVEGSLLDAAIINNVKTVVDNILRLQNFKPVRDKDKIDLKADLAGITSSHNFKDFLTWCARKLELLPPESKVQQVGRWSLKGWLSGK